MLKIKTIYLNKQRHIRTPKIEKKNQAFQFKFFNITSLISFICINKIA